MTSKGAQGFSYRPLSELCSKITSGGTPARSRAAEFYAPSGHPWVKTKELLDKPIDDTEEYITDRALEHSAAKLLPEGTILLAMYASPTVGRLGILRRPAACNQACAALIVDPGQADPRFVFYALMGERERLQQIASGSAQQNINAGIVRAFAIPAPEVAEQRRVASVLAALDDRIESNRRVAEVVEELGRALFRSWFVDFDPIHAKAAGLTPVGVPDELIDVFPASFEGSEIGPIPAGWTVRCLSELGRFVNGRALTKGATGSGRVIVRIAEMKGGIGGATKFTDAHVPDDQTARPGDLLFAWSGSLGAMRWSLPEAVINQHIFKCIPNEGVPAWVLEGFLQRAMPEFIAIAADKATTMGHIRRGDLDSPKGALPPPELMSALDEIAGPLLALRMSMLTEAHALEAVRDALLPKLVSGQLRVEPDEAQAA